MRCRRPDRALAAGAALAVLAACAPVQKEAPPAMSKAGIGTVQSARQFDSRSGESGSDRAVIGLLAGGLIGLAAATNTEDNLNRTMVWKYDVRIGPNLQTFFSHAVVGPGDCVLVETLDSGMLSVLTKVDKGRC